MRRAAVAATGLLLTGLLMLAGGCQGCRKEERAAEITEAPIEEIVIEGEAWQMQLLFPGRGGRLYPEERPVAPLADSEERIATVVRELLAGPVSDGLFPAMPEGVELATLHLDPEGLAYVDLASPDEAPFPPTGSQREILAVYSVVNSVLLNVPEVRAVVLLWNGQQRSSFAGHLDTSRPLMAKNDLTARR